MKKNSMKAMKLRNALLTFIILLLGLVGAGFYFGLDAIRTFAVEVSHKTADATASGGTVVSLESLKQQLAERQSLVTKANQLFSTPDTYQAQVLKDIQAYAGRNNVTISDYSFEVAAGTSAGETLSSQPMQLTLQSPVSYRSLLAFLDAIEGNLPKLQISQLTITRSDPMNADQVKVEPITIQVFTR